MSPPPLEAEGLTKRLGRRLVLSDVSFALRPGEVFGFLGPNGAGKTTTIRLLTGLARPDAGRVLIGGVDPARDFEGAMRQVGALVEAPDLYPYLSGRENLEHFARMLGGNARGQIPELAERVHLAHRLDDRLSTYSMGMRQRLGLAHALLGEPRVLILDEPANGLDPAGIREVRELLRALAAERGISVFVSSHLLAEVQLMCDRVAIIHRGRVLAVQGIAELLARRSGGVRFRVRPAKGAVRLLARFTGGVEPTLAGDDTVVAAMDPTDVPRASEALIAGGVEILAIEPAAATLEEMFLEMTDGETV